MKYIALLIVLAAATIAAPAPVSADDGTHSGKVIGFLPGKKYSDGCTLILSSESNPEYKAHTPLSHMARVAPGDPTCKAKRGAILGQPVIYIVVGGYVTVFSLQHMAPAGTRA